MTRNQVSRYVPALRFSWLTRFYDPLIRATLKEDKLRALLIDEARLQPRMDVLDVGCGTGTLAIMIAKAHPDVNVVGLDGDPRALELARVKAVEAGADIELYEGMAYDPKFAPASFDRVVSSLVFHHLTTTDKLRVLRRIHEVLRPGGEVHIADWGRPQNALMRIAFLGVQMLDGFETTRDSVRGALPELLTEAGFAAAVETRRESTVFGTLSFYRATKRE